MSNAKIAIAINRNDNNNENENFEGGYIDIVIREHHNFITQNLNNITS